MHSILFLCVLKISVYAQSQNLNHKKNTNSVDKSIHGKIDFLSEFQNDRLKTKLFVWNSKIKGGLGFEDVNNKKVSYFGGYYKHEFSKYLDDITIGGYIDNKTIPLINGTSSNQDYKNYEIQGDLFFQTGFGIGGGYVKNNMNSTDICFTKISFRNSFSESIRYTLALQMQFTNSKSYFGGLGAIYSSSVFVGGSIDHEQWRTSFGYIHPPGKKFRPALEITYFDNSIGNTEGANFFFINGTINFKGGFLSNEARLGRALGPTGIVFSNPLGFLNPNTWNRIHNTWELGKMLDFRVLYYPNSNLSSSFEGNLLFYPTNFNNLQNLFDNIFIGYTYSEQLSVNQHIISAGYFGEIFKFERKTQSSLVFSGSTGFNLSNNKPLITIGLILKH